VYFTLLLAASQVLSTPAPELGFGWAEPLVGRRRATIVGISRRAGGWDVGGQVGWLVGWHVHPPQKHTIRIPLPRRLSRLRVGRGEAQTAAPVG
jgi:hypothetical protein